MLIHYIIVRRDLPLGVLAAMVTHAAGESAAKYEANHVEGFEGCTAVVLEAKSEADLNDTAEILRSAAVDNVEVHESSGEFAGQFMAIGVVPGDREKLEPIFLDYQCLKEDRDDTKLWGV